MNHVALENHVGLSAGPCKAGGGLADWSWSALSCQKAWASWFSLAQSLALW